MTDKHLPSYAATVGLQSLRRHAKRGDITLPASLYIADDGIRVVIPIYDSKRDETTVCILIAPRGHVHVYKTLHAAKRALYACGITLHTVVRDGQECWA